MLNLIPFEERLSETDRTALARLAESVDTDAGELLFCGEQRHAFVYWIIEGKVSLEVARRGKTMRPLAARLRMLDLFQNSADPSAEPNS